MAVICCDKGIVKDKLFPLWHTPVQPPALPAVSLGHRILEVALVLSDEEDSKIRALGSCYGACKKWILVALVPVGAPTLGAYFGFLPLPVLACYHLPLELQRAPSQT